MRRLYSKGDAICVVILRRLGVGFFLEGIESGPTPVEISVAFANTGWIVYEAYVGPKEYLVKLPELACIIDARNYS